MQEVYGGMPLYCPSSDSESCDVSYGIANGNVNGTWDGSSDEPSSRHDSSTSGSSNSTDAHSSTDNAASAGGNTGTSGRSSRASAPSRHKRRVVSPGGRLPSNLEEISAPRQRRQSSVEADSVQAAKTSAGFSGQYVQTDAFQDEAAHQDDAHGLNRGQHADVRYALNETSSDFEDGWSAASGSSDFEDMVSQPRQSPPS